MSLEIRNFEFGEFVLDIGEKVLLKHNIPVKITPKAFLLLQELVRNHGHIVEKEQLMKAVWAGSFVEDGNLTFTVNLLRKVLQDDKKRPTFIETVPRRGYRFIAPVKSKSDPVADLSASPEPERIKAAAAQRSQGKSRPRYATPLVAGAMVLIMAAVVGSKYFLGRASDPQAPILSAAFETQKLSTDGGVHHAVLSRDGMSVVYTNRSRGKQSVWLRQLETSNNIEIIAPSDDFYGGLVLSPDDRILYFTRAPRGFTGQFDLYRVSVFGGIPTKIISETQGWIDVSKDGKRISFVRCYYRVDENCSLWLANSEDGSEQVKLTARLKPLRIGANQISPDGKTVAFAVGQSENQSNDYALMAVDTSSLVERKLTGESFFNIKGIAWLPDQSGVLFTAAKIPNRQYRIWRSALASGESTALTTDGETYATLSLDRGANKLVATQVQEDFRLNVFRTDDAAAPPQVLANAISIDFSASGQIVFSSNASGSNEIWSIGAEGGERKQLTNDPADETTPVFSPDSSSIFFASNRAGYSQIWRMNADGSLQTPIKTEEGGFPLFVSEDGSWLYYLSGLKRTLRRVRTDGEGDEFVLDGKPGQMAFAPDGSKAAFSEMIDNKRRLVLISVPAGDVIQRFVLSDAKEKLAGLEWAADGKSLVYILADADMQKNQVWFLSLESGKARRGRDLGAGELAEQAGFKLSKDGSQFAVGFGGWKHNAVLFTGLK